MSLRSLRTWELPRSAWRLSATAIFCRAQPGHKLWFSPAIRTKSFTSSAEVKPVAPESYFDMPNLPAAVGVKDLLLNSNRERKADSLPAAGRLVAAARLRRLN